MVNYTSGNIGLYAAGGSGDNLIPQGFVKAVEKVWVDYFAYNTSSTALMTTSDTLLIGYVPYGAKILGCEVILPTGFAPTAAGVNVGMSYSTSCIISNATIEPAIANQNTYKVTMNVGTTASTGWFIPTSSTSTVSGGTILTQTLQGIYLSFIGANLTAPTAGTIQTLIRYT